MKSGHPPNQTQLTLESNNPVYVPEIATMIQSRQEKLVVDYETIEIITSDNDGPVSYRHTKPAMHHLFIPTINRDPLSILCDTLCEVR